MRAVRELKLTVDASEEPWEAPQLCAKLKRLLEGAGLGLEDVLDAWDEDGDGQLPRRIYLMHFKRLVPEERLWYSKVRGCAARSAHFLCSSRSHASFVRRARGASCTHISAPHVCEMVPGLRLRLLPPLPVAPPPVASLAKAFTGAPGTHPDAFALRCLAALTPLGPTDVLTP